MEYATLERDVDFETLYDTVIVHKIRMQNLITPISPSFLQRKSQEIWKVVITGMATLENIENLLRHLTNVEILEFRNLSLDQYTPIVKTPLLEAPIPSIEAPRLVLLKLSSSDPDGNLTRSEKILLDFFTHHVRTPVLNSVEVVGTSRPPRSRWRQDIVDPDENNEVILRQRVHAPSILLLFLSKNGATMKDLKIARNFIIFGTKFMDTVLTPELLSRIQLKHLQFSVDTFGMDRLLRVQTRLESLTCEDCEPHQVMDDTSYVFIDVDLRQALYQCLRNCSATLCNVRLVGVVPVVNELPPSAEEPQTVHLSLFENCSRLRSLRLDLSTMGSSTFRMDASQLPLDLSSISIKVTQVFPQDLDLLTAIVEALVNLRQFIIVSVTEFSVDYQCLLNLLGKSHSLRDVELENGRLADDFSAFQLQNLLLGSEDSFVNRTNHLEPNRYWACKMTPKSILFEKYVRHLE